MSGQYLQRRQAHRRAAGAIEARDAQLDRGDPNFFSWLFGGGISPTTSSKASEATSVATSRVIVTHTTSDATIEATSTSTSSTTSSTISSTSSTSSSITKQAHTTTTTSSSAHHTSHTSTSTVIVAAASTSSSTSSVSGASHVGSIVGIVAGVLAGIVLLCVIIAFIVRHTRKRSNDIFNPTAFRRSAVLMQDPPGHSDTINAGFNPRPPSMVERPVTFGTLYGGGATPFYGTQTNPSSAHMIEVSSPRSAPSAINNPFLAPIYDGQSPFSPTSAIHTHEDYGTSSVLTRSPTTPTTPSSPQLATEYVTLNPSNPFDNVPPPVPQKDDMEGYDRSSIVSHESLATTSDFPVPPSPALTVSSRYRTPPVLPELQLRNSSIISSVLPSPKATELSTPRATEFPSSSLNPSRLGAASTVQRPETVYDPEDAYDGMQ